MPNYTGTVESFSTSNKYNVSAITAEYTITIIPDGGGSAITFTAGDFPGRKNYAKGDKVTYSGTQDTKGNMLYSLYV